jgi:squalene-hopene/tetraprenyl-beta-curcumene cyclase
MRISCLELAASVLLMVSFAHAADNKTKESAPADWNRFTAAQYLDAREEWWMNWPKAQRDHDTACVSCHTALPYGISRPNLHTGPNAAARSPQEVRMLGYITKRVTLWNEVKPFYSTEDRGGRKTEESRGTEAVMNAMILARYDQASGQLREITKEALAAMWSQQLTSGEEAGSWDWINFHAGPWESDESHYWGATLGAVTTGITPASYRKSPEVQQRLEKLREYLGRDYDKQPLLNQITVLWASSKIPGLLTVLQRDALLAGIRAHRQADGGWTTANLATWKRKDGTPLDTTSDGYATGLIVLALHEAKVPGANGDMQSGKNWLIANQRADGHWDANSVNKQREATADPYKFMSDAATAYATMALNSFDDR